MKLIPLKRLICCVAILLSILPLISFTNNSNVAPYRIRTIVIDAGHGGKAAGATGKYSLEKNIALSVALKLGKVIQEQLPGVKVLYTRTTDVNVDFHERIGIANRAKADLFISIHCNSMPANLSTRTSTRGVETFVAGFGRINEQDVAIRENADILLEKDYKDKYDGYDPNDPESMIVFSLMKNAFREQSIKLATCIQNEYVSSGRINRGVKEQNILVLQRAGMPAVLTEIGFISNPEEEDYLNSETGQNEIAINIVKAIQAYKKQVGDQ
ncbi:N-acetylmuramoyl-L-alanine amidase [Pedobacter sp. SYSU D00535]|uniref:N-acetylmuramoyl-L-alanine amidase family protein n=1 Tax=Pedobacter sp. SYSU D00535 TaxID=2810308 RepID=UPI001F60D73F|nr:N-acetylmuramoyl-L-alanine amidase [Pedobacter sp. SYSU D00535]